MNKLRIGLWRKRVYNSLKQIQRKYMPDYPEYKFRRYSLRLRPSDSLRWAIAKNGLPDLLNYFNASDIQLMLRVSVPNRKDTRNIKDSISYEWILCTDEDKPVEKTNDPRFDFYNTQGTGDFEFSMSKPAKKETKSENEPFKYTWYRDKYQIAVFKPQAIKIGNLSRLAHYKIIMKFTDSTGFTSNYVPMAEFTINDKDIFRHRVLLIIMGLLATAAAAIIAAIILKSCGIAK